MNLNRERVSVVCLHDKKILAFNAEDPVTQNKLVFLPGGTLEIGDNPIDVGTFKTLASTGYSVDLSPSQTAYRDYIIKWCGKKYFCQCQFFLAHLNPVNQKPIEIKHRDYNKGFLWIPKDDLSAFAYCKEIQSAIRELCEETDIRSN